MTYTVTNMKGGCGKSTLTIHLAAGLAKRGNKVLVIDHCIQGASSHVFLAEDIEIKYTAKDLYYNVPLKSCIYQSTVYGVDIVPANMSLLNVDEDFKNESDRNTRLRKTLDNKYTTNYDYVLIDAAPSLGTLVVNTLYAADRLIIPIDGIEALRSLAEYNGVIGAISRIGKNGLQIDSIVLTMVKQNSTHPKHIRETLDEVLPGKTCQTVISHSLMFPDAQAENKTIYDYAPRSHFAVQYLKLVDELLERWEREAEMELSKKIEQIDEDEEKVDIPNRCKPRKRKKV